MGGSGHNTTGYMGGNCNWLYGKKNIPCEGEVLHWRGSPGGSCSIPCPEPHQHEHMSLQPGAQLCFQQEVRQDVPKSLSQLKLSDPIQP